MPRSFVSRAAMRAAAGRPSAPGANKKKPLDCGAYRAARIVAGAVVRDCSRREVSAVPIKCRTQRGTRGWRVRKGIYKSCGVPPRQLDGFRVEQTPLCRAQGGPNDELRHSFVVQLRCLEQQCLLRLGQPSLESLGARDSRVRVRDFGCLHSELLAIGC